MVSKYGAITHHQYCDQSDFMERECICEKCDKFMCFDVLQWLVFVMWQRKNEDMLTDTEIALLLLWKFSYSPKIRLW